MTDPASPPDRLSAERLVPGLDAAVREAGALALGFAGAAAQWRKDDGSVVTEADIAVDRLLFERLSALEPAAAWLSEESPDNAARLAARRVWIVDPIDGTRAFVAGIPSWVVSVALVEDGRPVLGAIFNPTEDEMFAAHRGAGASLNGASLQLAPAPTLASARVSGPRKLMARLPGAGFVHGAAIYALAYRLASVAAGRNDAAISGAHAFDWDIAAADLILAEAGARLCALDGSPPRYNTPTPVHELLVAAAEPLNGALRAELGRLAAAPSA